MQPLKRRRVDRLRQEIVAGPTADPEAAVVVDAVGAGEAVVVVVADRMDAAAGTADRGTKFVFR